MTDAALENRALFYLERFSATQQTLRRVLMRHLRRDKDDAGACVRVDALVAKLASQGWVNDARFASNRTASLARRGGSTRAITQKLRAKGVSAEVIKENVAALDDNAAAITFALRKKLGHHRPGETSRERLQKDIAIMARAGFSYAASKRALVQSK